MAISLNGIVNSYSINRSIETTSINLNKSIEKLSSGYRINHAADDAAGLAVSQKLRTQVLGLNRAQQNIQDGISMYQTAESSLETMQDMMQRMRVLSIQSANDTLTSSDRQMLQAEVTQLVSEINRMIDTSQFNERHLFTPEKEEYKSLGTVIPTILLGDESFDLSTANISQTDKIKININCVNINESLFIDAITDTDTDTAAATYITGTASSNFWGPTGLEGAPDFFGGGSKANQTQIASAEYNLSSTITDTAGDDITLKRTAITVSPPQESSIEVLAWYEGSEEEPIENLHVGPDANDIFTVALPNLLNDKLNIDNINISSRTGAASAIGALSNSINLVSQYRSDIGAQINRLEHAFNFNGISAENQTDAMSQIQDTDYAQEMINLTKNQIIHQTSISLAAQANGLKSQQILSLFQ